jgi:hypothetical protein
MANDKVRVDITADGSQVGTAVNKAKKELGTLAGTAQSISKEFSGLGAALTGALSVGAFVGFLTKVNSTANALADLAARTGSTAGGLQAIQIAVAQAGGSMEAVEPALKKMSVTIGEAMGGSKQASEAFKHLGLSIDEMSKLKSDQAFTRIIQALSEIPNTSERAAAGTAILGKGYAEVAGLAAEGAQAIAEVNVRLDEQGARLTEMDTSKIDVMNDALQFQAVVVENLGTKFLAGLSPAIGVATSSLSQMLGNLGGATDAGEKFGIVMTAAIKAIEAAAYGLASVFETVRELIAKVLSVVTGMVSDLIGAFAYLTGAVGLDAMSAALKRGAETMGGISLSMEEISKTASENADLLAKNAGKAALDILRSAEIFGQARKAMEEQAAATAARNAAAQGAGTGYQIPESLGGGAKQTGSPLDRLQTQNLNSLTSETRTDLKRFDPAVDFEAIYADQRSAYLQSQYEAHAATMLGKFESFNSTWLGSMLSANATQIEAEAYKNQTIGAMMGQFAQAAINHGGTLGKIGKAIAIAQTIWSTATAIMKAMAEVPYPANIAAAAGVAAMGALQLSNIKKTNIGSAGSVAGVSGGGGAATPALSNSIPATAPSTESQQKAATQVIINGNLFAAQETVDWLVEQIGAAVNNRDMVFINGNSRQAMELVGA